ncbi:hypothetical protein AD006_30355 (plasmid) [Pseudonocardia sp. EC080610-09]|nr:hypothetical protein AD006_30355 [Pseudonocardia sp. EC080610-09]ALL85776.1 hypothetical protein AD017_30895 [Pseudonocardia sp. EC080619-01]
MDGERFVRGEIRYLDDEPPAECLHAVFVRSTVAHAEIEHVDTASAARVPGVHAVLTGAETATLVGDLVALPDGAGTGAVGPVTVPCLTADRVRFVGDPVAVVVADSERVAGTAADLVQVSYRPLPVVLDIDQASRADAPRIRPQLPTNTLLDGVVEEGRVEEALARAPHTVTGEVHMGRGSAVPLETRGCIARWDTGERRLLVRAALQNPHAFRANLARMLGLAEGDIRVVAPPLGGGFGFKFIGMPEEPVVCALARLLGRPVRWVESRAESLLVGAREYRARYRVGFDRDARLLGLEVTLEADVGALAATPGIGMPGVAAASFPGGYDLAAYRVRWRAVLTNKGPWNGARGFGKEITTLVLESAADAVARELGVGPVDVRRRNLLYREQLPHRTATMTIDSGDYHRVLDMALRMAGRGDRRGPVGPHVRTGTGLAFELTPEGRDPAGGMSRGSETATIRLDTSGGATVLTGVTSPGTGSETAIAQLVAERIGIDVAGVRVVQGDTDRTPYGGGSFSSRAVLAGGSAAWQAADRLRGVLVRAAATRFGVAPEKVEVGDGSYRAEGHGVSVAALAQQVRAFGSSRPGLDSEQLEATATYMPGNLQSVPDPTGRVQQYPTYSYGVYIAEVAVDIETGNVSVLRVRAVHDCGTVINPRMVDAQINGAVAMGIGIALTEEELYSPTGHPLSLGFKHYMLPRLADMPDIELDHIESPSPFTLLGTKGAGESGIGGVTAAVVSAVRDATRSDHRQPVVTPMTPPRVLELVDASTDPAPAAAGPSGVGP